METEKVGIGRIIGAILLIMGNSVGAGMLALPIFTGLGGFVPSLVMFLFAWLFMTLTGLLLLEVNAYFPTGASLISMSKKTLGRTGKGFTLLLWGFLFYTLLVAYIAGGAQMIKGALSIFSLEVGDTLSILIFALFFGALVYFGTKVVDHVNRYMMVGLIITYFMILYFGISEVQSDNLLVKNWGFSFTSLPILVISFGYHNIVPSLVPYLKGRISLLKKVIFIGSFLPLLIYLAFEIIILGVVPVQGDLSIEAAMENGWSSTDLLEKILSHSFVGLIGQFFAFFALTTSFIAVALSFVHFIQDAFKIKRVSSKEAIGPVLLVLLPPITIALIDPSLFLIALNYAGGIGAVTLFGIMPALMAWKCRNQYKGEKKELVPFGKPLLIIIILVALSISILSLLQNL